MFQTGTWSRDEAGQTRAPRHRSAAVRPRALARRTTFFDAGIAEAPFDAADVGLVQASLLGQPLLGEGPGFAALAQPQPEAGKGWITSRHDG